MARRASAREFKESAARLVTEQGYTAAQAVESLGVDPGSIRDWVKKLAPAGRGRVRRPGHRRRPAP